MNLKNPIKQYVTVIVTLALFLGAGVTRAAWTSPTQLPPNGNVDAPINVGYSGQIKDGWLLIKGMLSVGVPNTYGLLVENGNVGIGTLTPTSPLTVKKSVGSYGTPLLVEQSGSADASYKNVAIFAGNRGSVNAADNTNIGLWQKNSTVGNYANINFYNSQGQNAAYLGAKFINQGTGGTQSGAFVMGTYNDGISADRLYISETGNVGIGTVTPTARLDVVGKVKATSLQVQTATAPVVGQVLTATDTSGNVSWQTPSGGGIPTTGGFGVWNDINKDGSPDTIDFQTPYIAVTDGIVIAYAGDFVYNSSEPNFWAGIVGYTGNTPPNINNMKAYQKVSILNNIATITMPVKKGDYWQVNKSPWSQLYKINWLPIGE